MERHLKENGSQIIVQVVVILFAFFIMNLIIRWIWNENTVRAVLDLLQMEHDVTAASVAFVFFTKNISVIPLAMICSLKILFGFTENQTDAK